MDTFLFLFFSFFEEKLFQSRPQNLLQRQYFVEIFVVLRQAYYKRRYFFCDWFQTYKNEKKKIMQVYISCCDFY
jgi:hypothetical protein